MNADGNGGTFIRDSAGAPAARFTQAVAGTPAGRAGAAFTAGHAGGRAQAMASPVTAAMSGR
jgi:hypothetical protein